MLKHRKRMSYWAARSLGHLAKRPRARSRDSVQLDECGVLDRTVARLPAKRFGLSAVVGHCDVGRYGSGADARNFALSHACSAHCGAARSSRKRDADGSLGAHVDRPDNECRWGEIQRALQPLRRAERPDLAARKKGADVLDEILVRTLHTLKPDVSIGSRRSHRTRSNVEDTCPRNGRRFEYAVIGLRRAVQRSESAANRCTTHQRAAVRARRTAPINVTDPARFHDQARSLSRPLQAPGRTVPRKAWAPDLVAYQRPRSA